MKTWFAMQCNVVMSKHRSMDAAKLACRKRMDVFKKYPSTCYTVAQLESPGYWEKTDSPARRYFIAQHPAFL